MQVSRKVKTGNSDTPVSCRVAGAKSKEADCQLQLLPLSGGDIDENAMVSGLRGYYTALTRFLNLSH
ncbi:hypothetical protein BS640_09350 [Rouxiella badensis]|jgi:hypothetical protein|uniref:Uncharacterized protein n=1 Tax=Rouxiella badensis TaxID=1646377 RepID=A0A1X0WGG0_9GAMM|nr:hypothetical protein BS640_09350 [Rouxiella badensis]